MSSNVTYLSTRSLAAYETLLIESYGERLRRDRQWQLVKGLVIIAAFSFLAAMTVLVPIALHDFLLSLSF